MYEAVIKLHIERLPEGLYLATGEDVPDLLAQGRTIAETIEIARDVARKLVESYIEHGDEIPPALRGVSSEAIDVAVAVPAP